VRSVPRRAAAAHPPVEVGDVGQWDTLQPEQPGRPFGTGAPGHPLRRHLDGGDHRAVVVEPEAEVVHEVLHRRLDDPLRRAQLDAPPVGLVGGFDVGLRFGHAG
jgi:hypothetical protein